MSQAPGDSGQFSRIEQALEAWLDYLDQGGTADPDAYLQDVDPAAYLRGLLRELARRNWSRAAIARDLMPRSRDWTAEEAAQNGAAQERATG